jgi:phosphate transport system substrate-binding protein
MKKIMLLIIAFLSLSISANEHRLSITGSSTIAPLMMELAKAYEAKHPGVKIEVQMGGSSRGVTDVINSTADIGMVSRALNENENKALRLQKMESRLF